jgi:pimeloyl-ACP methyl ester carboxylesterase
MRLKIAHIENENSAMNQTLFVAITLGLLLLAGCAAAPKSSTQSLADAPSHFIKLGTNQVHYVTAGRGNRTLVFIHGWSGNLGFWREQVPAFAGKARLILIDLPGHGQSDKPHTAYTMDFFAGAVLAVMRDVQVDKAALVGHGMGVAVICRLYQEAPEQVAALVAVDGSMRRPKRTPEETERFIAPFCAPDYRENTKHYIGMMFPGTEALRDQVLAEVLSTPQFVMVGAMKGMYGDDQRDWDLKKVSIPVLVINSKNQMLSWSDEYKEYVRSLSPQTDYLLFEGASRYLMLEKPAEFNAALTKMLGKFDLIAK